MLIILNSACFRPFTSQLLLAFDFEPSRCGQEITLRNCNWALVSALAVADNHSSYRCGWYGARFLSVIGE